MAEDWNAIAAEIEGALKSVGSTDAGFPVVIRKMRPGGGDPWNPGEGTPEYHEFVAVESNTRERDQNGTLVGERRRTLTVSATAGVAPSKADRVAVGINKAEVMDAGDDAVAWQEIAEVYPLAPAGTAVLYDLDLVT